jgi:hypothetical protein
MKKEMHRERIENSILECKKKSTKRVHEEVVEKGK